jgi:cytochrome P450
MAITSHTVDGYLDSLESLRDPQLAQSLYDEGSVIMADVLLVLHGAEHRARRLLELKVFRRDFFRYYEQELFPATLSQTMRPFVESGHADLIDLGYRVTMNLTADFAGIDRPLKSAEETKKLLALVMCFSEGATLVHSTRNKEEVRQEVRAALREFEHGFYMPSLNRRRALLERVRQGDLAETELPRDVLTVLAQNEDRIDLPPDVMMREIAFYLQAGSHSTANATAHAFHDLFTWASQHPEDAQRMASDPLFQQRCVHESLRLHPASPVAWRKPICPMHLPTGDQAATDDKVIIDLAHANRDTSVFGADADVFNPHRTLPDGVPPWGLTFGVGVHTCLGRDLDGGVLPRQDSDPATHQYGIVPLFVRALFAHGARPDPQQPARHANHTQRPNWGSYPILFGVSQ